MWYAALAHLLRLQDGTFAVRSADYPECEGRSADAWAARQAFRRSLAARVQQLITLGQVPKLYRSPELQAVFPSHCRLQIPASDRAPNTFDFGVIEPVSLSGEAELRFASLLPPPIGAACKPAETAQGDGRALPAATIDVTAVPPPAPVRTQDAVINGKHSSSTSERVQCESGVVKPSLPQFSERVSSREPNAAHIDQSLRQQAAILPLRAPPNDAVGDDTAGLRVLSKPIRIGSSSELLPHLAFMLAAIAANANVGEPVCVVLPAIDGLAEMTAVLLALECLARDFVENSADLLSSVFVPGSRVRTIADGSVYEVGNRTSQQGVDGFWLKCLDKRNYESAGRIFVRSALANLFERTSRKRPIGPPRIATTPPNRTIYDLIAGVTSYGNSALLRNRVTFLGSRTDFERALHQLVLVPEVDGQTIACPPLEHDFCWGFLDEDGRPVVTHPRDALGQPLVAVDRDLLVVGKGLLANHAEWGRSTLVTSEIASVLRNLDLIDRIAERQKVLLIAESRRRDEARQLLDRGWIVWEPQPREIVPHDHRVERTGLPGLDLSLRSAACEARNAISQMERRVPELSEAFEELSSTARIIRFEAREEDVTQEVLQRCWNSFFTAAGWFEFPSQDQEDEYRRSLDFTNRRAFTLVCGEPAANGIDKFTALLERFVELGKAGEATPKGALIIESLKASVNGGTRAIATGHPRAKHAVQSFLSRREVSIECLTSEEIIAHSPPNQLIITSALNRRGFSRLVDPWPAERLILTGYDFEVGIYSSRLSVRQRAQRALSIDERTRSTITRLPNSRFGRGRMTATLAPPSDRFAALEGLAESTELHWSKRPRPVFRGDQEQLVQGLFCRFVGQSWAVFTEDHQCIVLEPEGQKAARIIRIDPTELRQGSRVIMREAGERDVIRAIAERMHGASRYADLRRKAELWRDVLRNASMPAETIGRRLQEIGIKRNVATVRSWITDSDRIGPRQTCDIEGIAEAFGGEIPETRWNECIAAVERLRSLHVQAGGKLSEIILAQCGDLLLESAEHEMAVLLDVGTAWILEVGHVDEAQTDCPISVINRLQWDDEAWRERLMRQAQAAE